MFAFIFAGVFLIHFIQKANLTHTLNWNYDAQTAEILEDIEQMEFSSIAPQGCIMLGVDPHLEPTINFYKKTRDYHWINDIPLDGYYDSLSYDYKVFIKSELPAFAKDWLRLKEYQTAETILYK